MRIRTADVGDTGAYGVACADGVALADAITHAALVVLGDDASRDLRDGSHERSRNAIADARGAGRDRRSTGQCVGDNVPLFCRPLEPKSLNALVAAGKIQQTTATLS